MNGQNMECENGWIMNSNLVVSKLAVDNVQSGVNDANTCVRVV